jgi:hypothetical protein
MKDGEGGFGQLQVERSQRAHRHMRLDPLKTVRHRPSLSNILVIPFFSGPTIGPKLSVNRPSKHSVTRHTGSGPTCSDDRRTPRAAEMTEG